MRYHYGRHRHHYDADGRCDRRIRSADNTWKTCGAERPARPDNARPRDECQVCEKTMALKKSDRLGNHGYQRPGWGHIVGNCYGVGHKPFPETTALIPWLKDVNGYLAAACERLLLLETGKITKLTRQERKWVQGGRQDVLVTYEKPETDELPPYPSALAEGEDIDAARETWRAAYDRREGWKREFKSEVWKVKGQVASLTRERDRVAARIEKAEKIKAERAEKAQKEEV